MRVSHGHLDRLVPHQLRNGAKINTSHDETTGKGVPEAIPREVRDTCPGHRRLKPVFVPLQRLPMNINKNPPFSTGAPEQLLERRQTDRVQRNVPRDPVLALRNRDQLSYKIDPVPCQPVLLAWPHACVQCDVELRHVTGAHGLDDGP